MGDLLTSKDYIRLLFWTALLAVQVTLAMAFYLLAVVLGVRFLWDAVAAVLYADRRVFLIVAAPLAGLFVGLTRYLAAPRQVAP